MAPRLSPFVRTSAVTNPRHCSSNPVQLKWERQTPASHLMQLVHVSRWNRSHVSVRVRLVRAASSHNTVETRLTSNGKHIEQNQRPQLLCVLLVQRIYAIDLAHDATVGERSRNSKFSYVSPRSIYGETSNEYSDSSTYLCRSRAEAFK